MFCLGKILLLVPVVHYKTSQLKMLAIILIIKEMLIPLRRNHACLQKARGIKQKGTVRVISKNLISTNV